MSLDFQSTPGRGLSSGSEVSGPGGLKTLGRAWVTTTRGGRVGAQIVHPACTKLCARVREIAKFAISGEGGVPPPGGPKMTILGGVGGSCRPPPRVEGFCFGHKAKQSEIRSKNPGGAISRNWCAKSCATFSGVFSGGIFDPPRLAQKVLPNSLTISFLFFGK